MDRLDEYDTERLLEDNEALSRRNRLLTRENSAIFMENRHLRQLRSEMVENNAVIIIDTIDLFEQMFDRLGDQMTIVQEENKNLAIIVSDISKELKRKGDHQPVVIQKEQAGNVVASNTIACNKCNRVLPIDTFREKKKIKDKNGNPFISVFMCRTCPSCRRKKLAEQKKTRVV